MKKILLLATAITTLSTSLSFAAQKTVVVTDFSGIVERKDSERSPWISVKKGIILKEGASVRTKSNSWILLTLITAKLNPEPATIRLKPDSEIMLSRLYEHLETNIQTVLLDLSAGEALVTVRELYSPLSKFEVKTPTSIIDVKGAKFSVSVKTED